MNFRGCPIKTINQTTWYYCENLSQKQSLCHTFNHTCSEELSTPDPDWLGITIDKTHDRDYYDIVSFNHIRKNFDELARRLHTP